MCPQGCRLTKPMARRGIRAGGLAVNPTHRELASMALLWPALAAESASEFASALAREFVGLAVGPDAAIKADEPGWNTQNRVALELAMVRLRDFSSASEGTTTLICAPFALHGATIVDLASRHSLIEALQRSGIHRLFVTDWRSATAEMQFCTIDDYLATLNILIDQLGGTVDLVGLCQGGWMSLTYAARFPDKVRKLVLAGAPIDIAAGRSKLSVLANNTPGSIFNELVELGEGRVLGHHALQFWAPHALNRDEISRILEPVHAASSLAFQRLESRFRKWYAWTVDLPGSYYLQVVQQLFKENRLASGTFVALGQRIDLSRVRCPLFLLAARDDDVVVPEQIFATQDLVNADCRVNNVIAPCGHLGLFMGRKVLSTIWTDIAHWLVRSA
jgi:poly(3-hydroxyalkanoate) synthetase